MTSSKKSIRIERIFNQQAGDKYCLLMHDSALVPSLFGVRKIWQDMANDNAVTPVARGAVTSR